MWAVGGLSSDGDSVFVASGNSMAFSTVWDGSDTVFRFAATGGFSGQKADWWTPANWHDLDYGGPTTNGGRDLDLGGSGPILVDVANANPSKLVVALGKDGKAYLLDRTNLGQMLPPVDSKAVAGGEIINAAATATTPDGTFVVFHGHNGAQGLNCASGSGDLVAFKITATSPPTISDPVWCAQNDGQGSPLITMTDASGANAIVWTVGAELTNRLHGWLLKDGTPVFTGGGANDAMNKVQHYQTSIAVKGRIITAADGHVYAFTTQ
jgi:hypothetical protein